MTYREPARTAARSTLRPLAAPVLVALISLSIAGCGSTAPSETGTAIRSGTARDTSSNEDANATHRDQAMRFSACMRENGVGAFPDPDASGELTIDGIVNGSSLDTNGPAWKQAIDACQDLQPPGFTGHERSVQEQESALAFAQCIRDNGVEDFPDPTADAPLVDTNRIPSTAGGGGMSALNAAMERCGDRFADDLGLGDR